MLPQATDLPASSRLPFEVESIGSNALEAVSLLQGGTVLGKTSRGIFIKSTSKWLLFVSCEPFRGPLTITIGRNEAFFQAIDPGMPICISSEQLHFPTPDLRISLQNALVYRSPLPARNPGPEVERRQRLKAAWEIFSQNKSNAEFKPFIPLLSKTFTQPTQDLSTCQAGLIYHYEKSSVSSRPRLLEFFLSLLGSGNGLTPSGDDFVLGSLLALNRWGDIFLPGYNPQILNNGVVAAAYQKTTTLSANLIECAAQGQADERLIAALDWLMSGSSPDMAPIVGLLNWGNSSGGNVFIGFLFALSLQECIAVAE